MPAKKKASKKTQVDQQTKLIAMQGICLAIIAGVVLFGVLRMVQLRDSVDAMIMQQLATPPVQVQPTAAP